MQNPIQLKVPLFLLMAVLITACTGYHYVASPQFVPLNTKKGEFLANIYPSGAQLGYTFSDHFSAFATGYKRFGTGQYTGNPLKGAGKENSGVVRRGCGASEVNVGVSYFQFREPFVFEVLLGGGAGKMNYQFEKDLSRNYVFRMTADRKNIYLQPDFGIKFNRHLELGLFARFNYLLYDNLNTEIIVGDVGVPQKSDQVFLDRESRGLLFVESGASFKAGWTNMKFHVQLSPNINLHPQHLRYQKLNLNLGLSFNADLLRGKRE